MTWEIADEWADAQMPDITLMCPYGRCYKIITRQTETLLKAWFDEVLPHMYVVGRPGISAIYSKIMVYPIWAWGVGSPSDPDWLCDSRVLGRWDEFAARNGLEGLAELLKLRLRLEAELRTWKAQ
jgi:hypothetical protein